jgi:hypothetical protein
MLHPPCFRITPRPSQPAHRPVRSSNSRRITARTAGSSGYATHVRQRTNATRTPQAIQSARTTSRPYARTPVREVDPLATSIAVVGAAAAAWGTLIARATRVPLTDDVARTAASGAARWWREEPQLPGVPVGGLGDTGTSLAIDGCCRSWLRTCVPQGLHDVSRVSRDRSRHRASCGLLLVATQRRDDGTPEQAPRIKLTGTGHNNGRHGATVSTPPIAAVRWKNLRALAIAQLPCAVVRSGHGRRAANRLRLRQRGRGPTRA